MSARRSRRAFVADCAALAALAGCLRPATSAALTQRIEDGGARAMAPPGGRVALPALPELPRAAIPAAVAGTGVDEPLFAAATRLDRVGRVLAPVQVDGQGPFRFIVDTGANRSALSPALVARLGLVPGSGAPVRVVGVTGATVVPTVRVGRLEAGALRLEQLDMPVVEPRIFAQADGILGVEGMSGKRLEVDFLADRVTITRSRGERPPEGFLIVPVERRRGGLLIVDARIGRIRGRALIDTGAERTLGNPELQRQLALDPRRAGMDRVATQVHGATDAVQAGESLVAPPITLGDATLDNLEVTFADLPVFRFWKLDQVPALLVGMDLLGVVARFAVDYRRAELQIQHRGR